MKITRIYNDAEGKSHFGEVEIALKDGGPALIVEPPDMPVPGIHLFKRTDFR